MSLKTKKRFKNIGKVVACVLFALLLFTNIKVAMMDDAEILNGSISFFGVEISFLGNTYAKEVVACVVYHTYSWYDPVTNTSYNMQEAMCSDGNETWYERRMLGY